MSIKVGSLTIADTYFGSSPISAIYQGSNLIWQRTPPVLEHLYDELVQGKTVSGLSSIVGDQTGLTKFDTGYWNSRIVGLFDKKFVISQSSDTPSFGGCEALLSKTLKANSKYFVMAKFDEGKMTGSESFFDYVRIYLEKGKGNYNLGSYAYNKTDRYVYQFIETIDERPFDHIYLRNYNYGDSAFNYETCYPSSFVIVEVTGILADKSLTEIYGMFK